MTQKKLSKLVLPRAWGLTNISRSWKRSERRMCPPTQISSVFSMHFYRVRRNAEWRKAYYDLFETSKNSTPSFESIIRTMYEATGNIEASFSSKMLATINPEMPIWDRYVVQNLCLEMRGKTKEDQLKCAVDLYNKMISWYEGFLQTENGRDCIAEFDLILPGYVWMSDVKKIDFYLWSIRD